MKCSPYPFPHLLKQPAVLPLSAHMKNKSEFQVTIQSIPSQSAIIGWRHMAAELKSIGQQGWRRPNWCQLRLQHYCRNTGLLSRPLWRSTFNSLDHSYRAASAFIPLSLHVCPIIIFSDIEDCSRVVVVVMGIMFAIKCCAAQYLHSNMFLKQTCTICFTVCI